MRATPFADSIHYIYMYSIYLYLKVDTIRGNIDMIKDSIQFVQATQWLLQRDLRFELNLDHVLRTDKNIAMIVNYFVLALDNGVSAARHCTLCYM